MNKRYLAVGFIVAATLLSGVVHGRLSSRWQSTTTLVDAGEQLQAVPSRIGDWQVESSEKLSDAVYKTLERPFYIARTYRNLITEERVNATVLLGLPGPICVHTPEICFTARDYAIQGTPRPVRVKSGDGPDDEFRAVVFRSSDVTADVVQIYYGWSDGGPWQVPENRRFAFASHPHLYKIQIGGITSPDEDPKGGDVCQRFLQVFLPALKPHMVVAE